ncbi:MAG TPA: hypothetical protein VMW34_08595, partial [Anaerolineales bacterium]|nr:hypothetical protein [Anaerolineales bacterium]
IRIWILEYFYQTTWTSSSGHSIWIISSAGNDWGLDSIVGTIGQIYASWIVGEAIKGERRAVKGV